ncbi:alpha/beta hydrolase, partial [Amaricoccus sp. HAR-UPW-R2A-40]
MIVLAQFAGQGYVVVGADCLDLGLSTEPDGYIAKARHQQAGADMLAVSREMLAGLGVATTKELFLAGWSQGGFVTLGLLLRTYHGVPGLARSVITDEIYEVVRRL